MSVMLKLSCGGCDATADVGPLHRRYGSVFGGNLCRVTTDDPETLTPDGWVMWDPYTHCTYCPTCWSTINENVERTRRLVLDRARHRAREKG